MHHTAVELQLPTAVLRMRKPQSKCGIAVALRQDVHHIGCIALDVNGLQQALGFELPVIHRLGMEHPQTQT